MDSYNIPISDLRQYLFCPRIPYFTLLKGLNVQGNFWLRQGLSFHDRSAMLTKRRNLSHYGVKSGGFRFVADIKLYDEELGLHGICDGAIYTDFGDIHPLEFKLTENQSPVLGAKVQLTAYAILLEKKENRPISRGFILMGNRGKTYEVQFSNALRSEVMRVATAIRTSMELATLPSTAATNAQCCQCEYSNFCADRE